MLRKLGVDNAVSSTEIITRLIEQEVAAVGLHLLASLNKGRAAICTLTLPKYAAIDGISVKDLQMPKSSLLVSLLRDERLIIPQGDTVIHAGDEIIAVCESASQKELLKLFNEVKH